eukprot:973807-Rhodomonas_salina.1
MRFHSLSWGTCIFLEQAVVAATMFVKMVTGALLGLPALVKLYNDPAKRCYVAGQSLLHSAFDACGTKSLDLTEMFDTLSRGNVHAWGVLDFISRTFSRTVDEDAAQTVTMFL